MVIPLKRLIPVFSVLLVALLFVATRHEDLKELAATTLSGSEITSPPPPIPASHKEDQSLCEEDLNWLATYEFSAPFNYASRKISTSYVSNVTQETFSLVETPLFSSLRELNLTENGYRHFTSCDEPITLDVLAPLEQPIKATNMIFGMQTTIRRLSDTVVHLARWIPKTGAHLVAVVIESEGVPALEEQMRAVENQLQEAGIYATVIRPETPSDSFPQRYFSLTNLMHQHRTPETEWLVLIDDDTFIPSMPALLRTLSKYNPREPYYVGSLSEDWWAVNHYGLMGFGGAGIFLSIGLTTIITEPKIYKACKEDLYSSAGDVTTMRCIYNHTPYKLTHIPALHQMDIGGDTSGVWESGRPILTVHHWKGGGGLPIDKMHLISDICDAEDCFLRRWQFQDKFVLTNGYSINQYPFGETLTIGKEKSWFWGKTEQEMRLETDEENQPAHVKSFIAPLDFGAVEKTWFNNEEMDVKHSFEPTRPGLELGKEKLQHRLIDAVKVGNEVRQVYFREGNEAELDTVLVLYWNQDSVSDSSSISE